MSTETNIKSDIIGIPARLWQAGISNAEYGLNKLLVGSSFIADFLTEEHEVTLEQKKIYVVDK